MGTRRSRHNKGRKVEGQHNLAQVNCALCFAPVFVAARKHNRKRHILCTNCANGVESPHIVQEIAHASLDAGKGDFLKCEEAKALDLTHVMMMTDEEAASIFERIRFSSNAGRPDCPRCTSQHLQVLKTRQKWRCKSCSYEFTITSGTIFASRKLPIRFYLSAIALMINGPKGLSISQIGQALGCEYKTIYRLAIELRQAFTEGTTGAFLIPPDEISTPSPRYINGGYLDSRLRWTIADHANLIALCNNETKLETSAAALGRTPKIITRKAIDLGLRLPQTWASILPSAPRKFRVREAKVLLSYPFITKPRPEHADLLAVNALVPTGFSPETRADICQEIMVAMFEGAITLDEIKKNRDSIKWFIRKFYRENMEDSGRAVSLSGLNPDDDREYYDIASSISAKEWDIERMNEQRNAYDAISRTHTPPMQFDNIYAREIEEIRRYHHEQGEYLSAPDIEALVQHDEFRKPNVDARMAIFDDARQLSRLLVEHGLTISGMNRHNSRGAVYVIIKGGGRVRVSDHPPVDARLVSHQGTLNDFVEEFDWRSDLCFGHHFKKIAYYSLEALADDLIELRAVKPVQHNAHDMEVINV